MTDDEVRQWLSDEERSLFALWSGIGFMGNEASTRLVRSLAETRKALAVTEWSASSGGYYHCPICDADAGSIGRPAEPHKPTCIFATMPRPACAYDDRTEDEPVADAKQAREEALMHEAIIEGVAGAMEAHGIDATFIRSVAKPLPGPTKVDGVTTDNPRDEQ